MIDLGQRTETKVLSGTYILTLTPHGANYMTKLLTHQLNDRIWWTTLSIAGDIDTDVISIMWSKVKRCTKFLDLDIVTQDHLVERPKKRQKIA